MIRTFISDRAGIRVATVPSWAVGLGAFGFAALGLLLFVIGAGLALILAPLAIGAIAIARWRLRSMLRTMAAQRAADPSMGSPIPPRPANPSIIEGEFRVIEPGQR